MPAHVERKPWAGTFDSLTWAPAPCLACEMVPFFLTKMPCIRVPSLCVRVPVAYMCCDVLHHSCTQWQAAIYFNNNIRNLQNSFNDDLSLRALATSLAAFLLPIFSLALFKSLRNVGSHPRRKIGAKIWDRKLCPRYTIEL